MRKIILLIIFVTALFQFCNGQTAAPATDSIAAHQFYSDEFKWRIDVPPGYVKQNAAQFDTMQTKGAELIGKGLNTKIDDRAYQICSFKYKVVNYFEVNKHQFSVGLYGDFLSYCKTVENEFYTGFKNSVPVKFKIDTVHSTESVDGLLFQRFTIQVSDESKVAANMVFYTRLFGNNEFSVIIVYADKESGDKMLNAWKSSKFN